MSAPVLGRDSRGGPVVTGRARVGAAEPIGPPARARVEFTGQADARLVDLVEAGHPVLLVARWSDSGGGRAIRQVVKQVYAAARGLAVHGVHVTHLLPDDPDDLDAQIRADLVTLPSTSHTLDRPFENRFFFTDAARAAGLLLAVSVGSGRKVDAQTLHQPAVLRTAQLIGAEEPGVVFASDLSRLGRSAAAFGPIPLMLGRLHARFTRTVGVGPWIGDEDGNRDDDNGLPLQPYTPALEGRLLTLAGRAEAEALRISGRNLRGKQGATPGRLVDGRAAFGWEYVPPPGFATARLMDPVTGRAAGNLLYLDTAAHRPDPGEVALRLPVAYDEAGQPVDQADNVAWLLAHLGRPGYDLRACAEVLVARRFSTPGLRRHTGAQATWTLTGGAGQRNASKIVHSVLRHLEVYETGVWTIERTDAAPIRIENMLPDGGRWLPAERAGQIRAYLAELSSTRPRPRVATFTGHPARIGAVPVRLRSSRRADGQLVYYLWARQARQLPELLRAAPLPPISGRELAASIADGLAQAADHLAPLVDAAGEAASQTVAAERDRVAAERDRLQQANRRRVAQLDAGDGAYEPSSRVRREIRAALERTDGLLADVEEQLRALTRRIADHDRGAAVGVPTDRLLAFVASLRDPYADAYRPALRAALSELDLTPVHAPGRRSATAVAWAGQLVLQDGADTWMVPVRGCSTPMRPAGPVLDERVTAAVAALRVGTTVPQVDADWRRLLPAVRAALALDGPFHLGSVTDPRLLRLGIAVLHPAPGRGRPAVVVQGSATLTAAPLTGGGLRRLAAATGEPLVLLRRLAALYSRPGRRARWLHAEAPTLAEIFAAAGDHGGRLDRRTAHELDFPGLWTPRTQLRFSPYAAGWDLTDPDVLRLLPCPHCGSPVWPSRLREADGPVCTACRRDRAGVGWPVEPYGRYDQPRP